MFITDVFDSMSSSKAWYDKSKLNWSGVAVYPFVSRTKVSNGVDGFCSRQEKEPEPGNAVVIGLDTQTIGYQPVPFYTSQNIQILRSRHLDQARALVLIALIREQMGKFSWGGNGATLGRLQKTRIMVPAITSPEGGYSPDWGGITELGNEVTRQIRAQARHARQSCAGVVDSPPDLRFEPMLIPEVFAVCRQAPAWLNTNEVAGGVPQHPHVTNTARRNSIAGFIAQQRIPPNPGNAITVGIDTQVVAYQPVPYYGATKVLELRSPMLNETNAGLLMTSLREALKKFSWGHKASAARLRATRIMVPVTTGFDGQTVIDWDGMTAYGRTLRLKAERALAPLLEVT